MGDRSFRLSFSPQRHGSLECVNRKKQPVEKYERGTRSYTMSHIRGKDTKIEVLVRSYLFRKGLRFRKNDKRYPGHPDVVLPKYHAIVFGKTTAQSQSRHRAASRTGGRWLACNYRMGVRINESRARRTPRTAV